ncbi:hypothetical protein BU14_1604s0003 [Porphyra umbilicalis]|uniref:Uncharacterized protein n=1 Tax=Porphyra umbilicalis TaxID=2786 RepID=A0A1X6NLX9_PORUM|nr:hypothetical protein BU14_1604s0003 [Porphyra umbilicalis]|eukprot:OSX69343.1 hypothetical protein BU14_1604s0003 [Porphyra umbilicalis]
MGGDLSAVVATMSGTAAHRSIVVTTNKNAARGTLRLAGACRGVRPVGKARAVCRRARHPQRQRPTEQRRQGLPNPSSTWSPSHVWLTIIPHRQPPLAALWGACRARRARPSPPPAALASRRPSNVPRHATVVAGHRLGREPHQPRDRPGRPRPRHPPRRRALPPSPPLPPAAARAPAAAAAAASPPPQGAAAGAEARPRRRAPASCGGRRGGGGRRVARRRAAVRVRRGGRGVGEQRDPPSPLATLSDPVAAARVPLASSASLAATAPQVAAAAGCAGRRPHPPRRLHAPPPRPPRGRHPTAGRRRRRIGPGGAPGCPSDDGGGYGGGGGGGDGGSVGTGVAAPARDATFYGPPAVVSGRRSRRSARRWAPAGAVPRGAARRRVHEAHWRSSLAAWRDQPNGRM